MAAKMLLKLREGYQVSQVAISLNYRSICSQALEFCVEHLGCSVSFRHTLIIWT